MFLDSKQIAYFKSKSKLQIIKLLYSFNLWIILQN